jgi:molybdopterin converting factor small subunit
MKVRVQFFSSLRDIVGAPDLHLDVADNTRVAQVLAILFERHPQLRQWDASILIGAGVEFVDRDYEIQPGDDLAIMPPVQGG